MLSTQKKQKLAHKHLSASRKQSVSSISPVIQLDTISHKPSPYTLKKCDEQSTSFDPALTFQHLQFDSLYCDLPVFEDQPLLLSDGHAAREKNDVSVHIPSIQYTSKYQSRSCSISLHMRAVLLNWVAEVTELFMFKREVYQMAVNYIDRYLDRIDLSISKKDFQLLGMCCLYLASKFDVRLGDEGIQVQTHRGFPRLGQEHLLQREDARARGRHRPGSCD